MIVKNEYKHRIFHTLIFTFLCNFNLCLVNIYGNDSISLHLVSYLHQKQTDVRVLSNLIHNLLLQLIIKRKLVTVTYPNDASLTSVSWYTNI